MSDDPRDEIIKQFHKPCRCDHSFYEACCGNAYATQRALAGEIVRLRKELDEQDTARMTAELLLERERRTSESHFGMSVMYEKEYERARDILAALREPSEGFIDAVIRFGYSHFHGMPIQPASFLRAAVAAAEQEVQGA